MASDQESWAPSHRVPDGGMSAWTAPDPSLQPVVGLAGHLDLIVTERAGDWARVEAVNGWSGWVDGRRLLPTSNTPSLAATLRPAADGATCDACVVTYRDPESRGELQVFTPYTGYPIEVTLHPDCERMARMRTQRCFWRTSSKHKSVKAAPGDPLLLWFGEEEVDGLPSVSHEACALGGAFLMPDGSLKAQCIELLQGAVRCWSIRPGRRRYGMAGPRLCRPSRTRFDNPGPVVR